jgi:hypothetical protein
MAENLVAFILLLLFLMLMFEKCDGHRPPLQVRNV